MFHGGGHELTIPTPITILWCGEEESNGVGWGGGGRNRAKRQRDQKREGGGEKERDSLLIFNALSTDKATLGRRDRETDSEKRGGWRERERETVC